MKLIFRSWLILFGILFIFTAKNPYYKNSVNPSTIISRHPWPGEFKATDNRLGAVEVKFNSWQEGVFRPVIFKIKEKGSDDWHYQSEYYNTSNTQTFFPFGFPVIPDSKGKTYQIEIESPVGIETPYFFTQYSFPLNYLRQNPEQIPGFILGKISSWLFSLTAVPFINYLLILLLGWLVTLKQIMPKFWSAWLAGLLLVMVTVTVGQAIFGSSEKLEWGIYILFGAGFIPIAFILQRVKFGRWSSILNLTLSGLILWLSLNQSLGLNQLAILSLAAAAPLALFVNLAGILMVIAFFSNIPQPWLVILLTLLSYFFYRRLIWTKTRFNFQLPVWAAAAALLLATFYLVQKPIAYHHYSLYLGPAWDVVKGKSLFSETPSMYGYLSIHFLAGILRRIGFSLVNFHLLNLIFFVGYYFIGSLILLKLVKNRWLGLLSAIIFITLQTIFSDFNYALLPSTGPWRFGLGLLVIWGLTYLSSTAGFIFGSILSALAIFWSAETAIYVVPAWLATCLFFQKPIAKLIIFSFISLIIFWFLPAFPGISGYLEYALAFKNGFGALPIPLYGNYYLVIGIMILGLIAAVRQFSPLLVFVIVHNLAIFSYFVSRSHENNIVNLAGFFLIELILSLKIFRPKKIYALPLILFIVLYAGRLAAQTNHLNQVLPPKTAVPASTLAVALTQYGLESQPLVLLSEDNDTRLLIESKLKNELPLNPAIMTGWLESTWLDKYVNPAVDRLPIGAVVIVEPDIAQNFLNPVFERIRSRFKLRQIGIIHPEVLEIYQIIQAI